MKSKSPACGAGRRGFYGWQVAVVCPGENMPYNATKAARSAFMDRSVLEGIPTRMEA